MNKKIIFLDGDGTIWYPKKTKRDVKPHFIYKDSTIKGNYLNHLELTSGIINALEDFKRRKILLVIISANPNDRDIAIKEIEEKLNHFKIKDFFLRIESSKGDDPKDKGNIISKILVELNIGKSHALMIGDSYFYDYIAAMDVGVEAFWIENKVCKLPKIMPEVINKIKEVVDILYLLDRQ